MRSGTPDKRPDPSAMAEGQLAINTATGSPGVFFKNSSGDLVKIGPIHVGALAPNAVPAAGGTAGNTVGEQWLDNSGGGFKFKIWDGTAWRSEDGEFVNVTGDTMTGALVMANQQPVSFREATANGSNAISLSAPASVTADRTITLPDVSGAVVTTGDTGTVTSLMIVDGTIVNADINASAAIAGTKISPDFGAQDITTSGNILMTGTGAIDVAAGTVAERPGTPSAGMIRFNTDDTTFEGYDGSAWGAIGGAPAGVAGSIQINDGAGALGAVTDFIWDSANTELDVPGDIKLDDGGTYTTTIQSITATADRFLSFPDATGVVALVQGINGAVLFNNAGVSGGGNLGYSTTTGTFGYISGRDTETQATNKSTGVTLNAPSGAITMNNAALAADTTVSFTLTNSSIAATDLLVLNHVSGGTAGSYLLNAQAAAGSASINVRNITGGSLSEAIVIGFAVIKA